MILVSREELMLYLCPFNPSYCGMLCDKRKTCMIRRRGDDGVYSWGVNLCELNLFTSLMSLLLVQVVDSYRERDSWISFARFCKGINAEYVQVWSQRPFLDVIQRNRVYEVEVFGK